MPLKRARDGAVQIAGRPGQILGQLKSPNVSEEFIGLDPGDYVLMYTDGVVDARQGSEFYGEERLIAFFAESTAENAQELADAVGQSALHFRGAAPGDDIAVVALSRLS